MGLDHGLCQQLHLEKGSSGKSCLRKVAGFVLFPKLLSFLLTIIIMIIIIIIYLTAVVVLREFVVILRGVSFLVAKRQGGFPASRRKPGIPFNSFLLSLLSDNNWKPGCRLCVSPSVRVHTNSILCFCFFLSGSQLSAICPCTDSSTYLGAAAQLLNVDSRLGLQLFKCFVGFEAKLESFYCYFHEAKKGKGKECDSPVFFLNTPPIFCQS